MVQVDEEVGSKLLDILDELSMLELISATQVIEDPVSNIRRKGWDCEPILMLAKNK
jgi:hypothetical protein